MRTFVPLAIVGVAACVAVYAVNQNTAATSLFTPMTTEDHQFMAHVAKHGKSYGTKEEFEFRSAQFKENMAEINLINSENGNTFSLAANKFADWTKAEYKKLLGTKPSTGARNEVELEATAIPASLDWRTKNVVQKVKDQGQCGSCWAFSGIGALESAHAIKTGNLLSLSEQQIVDCARGGRYYSQGCNGG
jgi:C1A family cysteine protease